MNTKVLTMIIIFVTNFKICRGKKYNDYALFKVVPTSVDHLQFLHGLQQQNYIDVIFWKEPDKLFEEVQFLVNPKDSVKFEERIKHFGVNAMLVIPNVQTAFAAQTIHRYMRYRTESFSWEGYHVLDDIYVWLNDTASMHPGVVQLKSIGKSFQGRDIFAIGIKKKPKRKGTVIVEAGMHGDEWIAVEFATFLINALLVSDASDNYQLKEVLENYHWWVIPIANPDGFYYSHTTDRLWKKNRRPSYLDQNQFGVNLNRNFDYSFCTYGASQNPGHENFCGIKPFSEPETKALASFVANKSTDLSFFFSLHSYGQKIIIPYADKILHTGNYAEMENFAKQAIFKMYKMHGVKYTVGTMYDSFGIRISGNSASWVKKTYNVRYVFTILLRDSGYFGHALPAKDILPTCEETLAGVLEIMTANPRRIRADMFSSSPGLTPGCYMPVIVLVLYLVS